MHLLIALFLCLCAAGGKYDHAQDLCRKVLRHDHSCTRAWEYLGRILEEEGAYADAAEHYQKAWTHDNESSPAVGYKLAFNLLKARRFVRSIDVAHKVLERNPDYPRIREEVLNRARRSLRL